MEITQQREGDKTPSLNPLSFILGCNTPQEVAKAQLEVNVERDLPWLETKPQHDRALVIVAGGASLKTRWPEIMLHGADILSLNNSYSFLLDKGIIPDYWMLMDARKENVDFLRDKHKDVRHFVAAQCHPSIFEELKGFDTTLFLTIFPDTLELTSHIDKEKVRLAANAGTVGIKALSLAYALGYRKLFLYGYDSSYAEDEHHAYEQKLNDESKKIEVYLDDKKYITTATLANQATDFCAFTRALTEAYGFEITLCCDGLLPDMVAYCNKLGEVPLEDRERKKYEEMWKFDLYRKDAPGEGMVDEAIKALGLKSGDSVIDFGCGTGRASQKMLDSGLNVTSVDFASNCMDADVKLNFVNACLWDLPEMQADYGYCTDVMEHIPMEKVLLVLQGIRDRCSKGAFFNIATRPDMLGGLIGRKLHMTVIAKEDWLKILQKYWPSIEMRPHINDKEVTFICLTEENKNG
jgi:hypothetical protein